MNEKPRLNEFEPVTYESWRSLVEKDLKGADFNKRLVKSVDGGLEVQPLYTRQDGSEDAQGLPGQAPFVRGPDALGRAEMGWDMRQRSDHADVREASAVLEEDLAGGASSVWVRLDGSLRKGSGAPTGDGVLATQVGALEVLFEGVDLAKVPVALDSGAHALPAAAALFALAARRNVPASALSGWLYADPIGTLAEHGSLPTSLEALLSETASLATYCAANAPGLRAVVVRTGPYHDAGADAVEELAIAIASGIAYLRALVDAGLSVDDAASQMGFDLSVGRDFFVEIAKLRAARKLWARVVEVAGGGPTAGAMRMHAHTSGRTKTQRDPWVNMLRGTAESFAAVMGGADSITTSPFDSRLGPSDSFARRMARNTQVILQEESNLHRVVDPAGGSWYVEALTNAIAEAAWKGMQAYEAEGGIAEAVRTGKVAERLRESAARCAAKVATRQLTITGVNEYPSLGEAPVQRPAPDLEAAQRSDKETALPAAPNLAALLDALGSAADLTAAAIKAAAAGASLAQLRDSIGNTEGTIVAGLSPAPYSAGFETLRNRSDRALQARGKRPQVFLANLGPIPTHKARAAFATHVFEAGGIEVLSNDGFAGAEEAAAAFKASGAPIACLCSSDELYAEHAAALAKALTAAGARAVVLAGKPADADALTAAGVGHFIFVGSDARASLEALLDRVGA